MKEKFEVDDEVHYIPYEGCDVEYWENGVVTKIVQQKYEPERIYVKFLDKNKNTYTQPKLTPRHRLRKGWF
jgi:hypothetical protein